MTEPSGVEARDLRVAASGPLAQRFPLRWLDEHAVLPLDLRNGRARVAIAAPLATSIRDILERRLEADLELLLRDATEIRAALLAVPRTAPAADPALQSPTPWKSSVPWPAVSRSCRS